MASLDGSDTATSPTVRPTASFTVSKRAPKACANCHRRKVRCDAHLNADGQPCSYCRSTGHECVLLPGRRGSTYQKTKKRLAAQQAGLVPGSSQSPLAQSSATKRNRRQSDARPTAMPYQPTGSILSPSRQQNANLASPPSPQQPHHEINPSLSDEHVWVQFLDKVHDHSRTGGGLEQQLTAQSTPSHYHHRSDDFQQTRENSTERDGDTKQQVIVFNGETALDGAVPTIAGLRSLQGGSSGVIEPNVDPSLSFIDVHSWGPPSSWTTILNRSHVSDLKVLPEDDKKYLLDHKRVNVFPPAEVCDRLLKSFFRHIYPHLPILNRPAFLRGYRRMMSNGSYSLFLLHAVFYTATYHCSSSLIQACGFENRLIARAYFFSRAKMLHLMDAEREHLFTIQGCTLLSMWWTRYEEEKETRFFLCAAILLSQRMGMHRSIKSGWGLGASERRMWKRIFWTLYNTLQLTNEDHVQSRDHITASSLGKPNILKSSDIDVEDLQEEDFLENWGNMEEADVIPFCPPQTLVTIKYTIEMAKLAKIYEKIAIIQYSRQHRPTQEELESIATDLTNWKNSLPQELSTLRYDELANWTPENFWPILLQLIYDRGVSMHYRPRCSRPKKRNWQDMTGQTLDETADMRDREKARRAVVSAASNTLRLIEDLLRNDLLRFAPATVQTPLFIAMIVYAEEIKLSPESSPRFNLATNKINLGMMALGELRKIWAASSWTFRLFEYIIKNKFEGIGTPEISISGSGNAIAANGESNALNQNVPIAESRSEGAAIGVTQAQVGDMAIDPLLTGEAGGNPANLSSGGVTTNPNSLQPGNMFWNGNMDDVSPDPGVMTPFSNGTQQDNMLPPGAGPEGWASSGVPLGVGDDIGGLDLTWLAMSGLAGDLPFHWEGPTAVGGSKQNAMPKMGVAADLWSLLGLGEGGNFGGM